MENVPLLGDPFLSGPCQLFVGSRCVGGLGRSWTRLLHLRFPLLPSTSSLGGGRRRWGGTRGGCEREKEATVTAMTAPLSPPLEAPVLATEDHEDDVVVVVAAVATSSALASSARWRERVEKAAAAVAAGEGDEGDGAGARGREREGKDGDGAERRE
ncbi:hypothetical protein OsJ_12749 [Oryza sativa Japonica Group]|uniref:Uncharacterized protein n=1 Tax=Oryza sativa subsp. japonica TaxID=39947 RepID=A3AN40_ORYSJ|nr:hypothetical protein OsJ_12749 [Oryza sativa Japonica Group]